MISAASAKNADRESMDLFGYLMITLDISFLGCAVICIFVSIKIIRDKIKKMKGVKTKMLSAMKKNMSKLKSKKWLKSLHDNLEQVDHETTEEEAAETMNMWQVPSKKASTKVVPDPGKRVEAGTYNL